MKLALAIIAGAFFWGCIASALLIICIGQPFIDSVSQLVWSLK